MYNRKAYQKEYMKIYMPAYYKKNKKEIIAKIEETKAIRKHKNKCRAIQLLGGKCQRCGYNKCIAALDFHHKDGEEKENNIGTIIQTWSKVAKELHKCELLCSNCHRELHWREDR